MTATLLKRRIYHQDDPYAEGNDDTGLAAAAVLGVWIDIDLQRSLEGIFIRTHWPYARTEKFTLNGRRVFRPFRLIPWKRIARMRRKDGHQIRTAGSGMRKAKELGVRGIEFELKFVPSQRMLNRLAATARAVYGEDWREYVEIKMLQRFGWRTALRRAKAADDGTGKPGFVTTLIGFTGDPARLSRYYPFVDQYRNA